MKFIGNRKDQHDRRLSATSFAMSDKAAESRPSKLGTQSFHESLLRQKVCSGSKDDGHSKKASGAGSSSEPAKEGTAKEGTKYNKVSVRDLLISGGETDETGENICTINNCNRKFVSKESLLAHQRRAHAPPTAHVCPHCFSSFSTIPNLNKHIRTVHGKVKPFKCDQCSSSFAFRDGLHRHVNLMHTDLRPFHCPYCSMKFKTKAHLNKHSLAIHPEKHTASSSSSKP